MVKLSLKRHLAFMEQVYSFWFLGRVTSCYSVSDNSITCFADAVHTLLNCNRWQIAVRQKE